MEASQSEDSSPPASSKQRNNVKCLKLHEIIEMVNDERPAADRAIEEIVLFPPEDGDRTDEESGDETETNMNHLPGRILRSTVEVNVTTTSISEAEEVPAVRSSLGQQSSSEEVSRTDEQESTQRQWSVASSHVSIDETMVPYYGRHSAKQHIHGKPLRFGYKLWSAATRNGYLITFVPYQGAKAAALPNQEKMGLGAAVVLELESRLPPDFKSYNLYFDNFFTSLHLLSALSERRTGGTGTSSENRLKKCPLMKSSALKKEKRGAMSFKADKNIIIVKWHDNNVVTVASNCHGITPIQKVDRVAAKGGKRLKIQVDSPSMIQKYNKYMGGVDRFDENVDNLRVGIGGKKWWFPLFAFGIDAAC
ncbi:hypothetical protein ANN_03955 [Periplaneta americana]|uniref:PiggyBac transposable element-derived protein domain-containing protein n=1 Tax=Periplaneta americana TaxID=6978 RepID=A0ABQ8T8P4_PERAM|nr:hypothetical protein ANN_03955 [Periplaneta americana]